MVGLWTYYLRSGPIAIHQQPQKSKKNCGKRGQWTVKDMHLALVVVVAKNMTIRQAGEFYGIPSSSIHDWKRKKTKSKKVGRSTYLTKVEALALVN